MHARIYGLVTQCTGVVPLTVRFVCKMENQNSAQTSSTTYRNIVILGNIGSGKSTLVNRIVGENICQVRGSIESVTRSTTYDKSIPATARGCCYTFRLIDTAGVYDRNNHEIVSEIRRTFQEEIHNVNLVLFVYKDGRFTPENRQTLEVIMRHFTQISEISALIVTNCDQKGKAARSRIKEDIETSAKFITNFVKKGIFTVGFPNLSEIDEDMRPLYEESIKKDETMLRDLVDSCEEEKLSKEIMIESVWESLSRLQCHIL